MAFVNENITSEEDKALFNSFGFKNPITREILDPLDWTIDRERDIIFIYMGGQGFEGGEIPIFFGLVVRKKTILIETFYKTKGCQKDPNGLEIWWRITNIYIPKEISLERIKLIELLKEALIKWGLFGGRNSPLTTHFLNSRGESLK